VNRLDTESSPYLRQHADNPVAWYPWGDDAFAEARRRDVPIVLSVGYSSCHWCHVMAHESFEDDATAQLMNEHFVNVKVDREERPDVDAIYMEAVQRMTGHGGWPMTVFLAPDGRPFFGGTYFPKTGRQGMPSFTQILQAVSDAWSDNRAELLDQAANLTELIVEGNRVPPTGPDQFDAAALDEARGRLITDADRDRGGFGRAPKFPMAMALRFLAIEAARTGDDGARGVVTGSLDAMAAGGIHDHVGGGFHRYSTDTDWLVPHFEKMLYDQATLLRAYSAGYALTGSEHYRRVASGLVTYVLRDLTDPAGGWYAAEDADTQGVEGAFTCWQVDELRAVLGADADAVIAWAHATPDGNFLDPHTGFRGTILHSAQHDPHTPPAVLESVDRLLAARNERPRPGLDDKVLLGWNALFARALAEAAVVFAEPTWLDAARRNVTFLLDAFATDTGFARSWQAGRARHDAVLEDVAALLSAVVALAELDDPQWVEPALRLATALDAYADPDGTGWFTTSATTELIVRPKDVTDNAIPSGTSIAVDALLRLATLVGDPALGERAVATVHALATSITRHPLAFGELLCAAERVAHPSREIVIVAGRDAAGTALRQAALLGLGANDVYAFATPERTEPVIPLLEGRVGPDAAQPCAYVCHAYTCELPVTTVDALRAQLTPAP